MLSQNTLIDITIALILIIFILISMYKILNKNWHLPFFISSSIIATLILFYYKLYFATITTLIISIISAVIIIIINETTIKATLKNLVAPKKRKKIQPLPKASISFIDELNRTVEYLSENKIGAIITLERDDSLASYIESATKINASFSYELIVSIFYPGTPLHDGGVILKEEIVVAAAAFYQPTSTPLNGKFGSRHRAALGISETTDALTIIVSEETGRISFTLHGQLYQTNRANFRRQFLDFLGGLES